MSDEDRDDHLVVAWVLGLAVTVAIAVSLLTGLGATSWFGSPRAGVVQAAPAGALVVAGPVKLYFDTGKADAPADAATQLTVIIEAVKAGKAARAVISGFHDKTGNADVNEDLAKQRAMAVARLLGDAGLTEAQIDLRKPQEATGGSDDREARRVEITAEKG